MRYYAMQYDFMLEHVTIKIIMQCNVTNMLPLNVLHTMSPLNALQCIVSSD